MTRACMRCGYEVGSAADIWCEACGCPLGEADRRAERQRAEAAGVAGITDPGLVRPTNQDAFAVARTARATAAVVCDGVASSSDGRAAAESAVEATMAALLAVVDGPEPWDAEVAMDEALWRAAAAVGALGARGGADGRAPACTIVAALWDGSRVAIASAGDSRAYWLAPGASRQLTVDDSWAQEQVAAGVMTERTAMRQPQAHAITSWLGADAPGGAWRVDTFVPPGPGHMVLCTDGLWNHVAEPGRLEALLRAASPAAPAALADLLADAALAEGGKDNVTVVVMEVQP